MGNIVVLNNTLWLNLAVALGIGLLVGAERERSKGMDPDRSLAGIRTFTIVALLGPAALDDTIWEMLTISAQTEQANSATRGRIFHLLGWNETYP